MARRKRDVPDLPYTAPPLSCAAFFVKVQNRSNIPCLRKGDRKHGDISDLEIQYRPDKPGTQTVVYVLICPVICITALVAHFADRQGKHIALVMAQHNFHCVRVAFGCGYDYRERQQTAFVVVAVTVLRHRLVPPNSVSAAQKSLSVGTVPYSLKY